MTHRAASKTDPASYRLSPAEQETIIRWDREGEAVSIFSADPTVWRRLEKQGLTAVRTSQLKGQDCGRWYSLPKARFRYKPAGGQAISA